MHVIADYCINPAVHHESGVDCTPAAAAWATVVLLVKLSAVYFRTIFLTTFSLFPVAYPWLPSPRGSPLPSVFLNVSRPCSLSPLHPPFPPFPPLFCRCLFLSLYRTPNVSSNGNPGYESLPLTERQSPPPSVSSSVPLAPLYRCC